MSNIGEQGHGLETVVDDENCKNDEDDIDEGDNENCDEDPPCELVANDALEDGAEDGVTVGGLQEASQVQVNVIHRLVHPGQDDGHMVMVTIRVTVMVTMTVMVRVRVRVKATVMATVTVKATLTLTVTVTVTVTVTEKVTVRVTVTVTARYLFMVSICLGSMELLKSAQLLAFLPVQISLEDR